MLRRTLILVGLPGAGKSSVGRAAAEALGVPFVDLDREIESRTGRSVSQLFAEQGESEFRKLEHQLTLELMKAPAAVWAPGGGWVTVPGVLASVRPYACIIHLAVSPAEALARLRNDATIRPLLAGDHPEQVLDRLWQERCDAYASADHIVDTERLDFQRVVDRVVSLARTEPHATE
jgi:shikimate kinase